MYEYEGAIHIHSVFSDGSGKAAEIGKLADESGLDFLILTDHNTLRAKKEGLEGFYGNTLLFAGVEINDKENKNHYIAMGINETPSTRMPAAEYVKLINESGGIGFIAHPHEKRSSMKEHPPYPWIDWSIDDFTGIEIWNHMSEWMENLTEENKYQAFVHPLKSIIAPPQETLDKWDEIAMRRKVVGIGGLDAHAHKVSLLGFFDVEVFPYKVLFKSIRTHILTYDRIKPSESKEDIDRSIATVLDALKSARCFVANNYHAHAAGFRFFCEAENKIYQMGETVPLAGKTKLRVLLPCDLAEIILIRNGEKIDTLPGYEAEFVINSPGAYRVEIYYESKAWIFSNHIRIGI